MTKTSLGWRDTLNAIRGARNCANPNFGFQRQLMEYENTSLETARRKLKKDYPSDTFSDQKDCEALLAGYRKFVLHGDSNGDDGLYTLPYNAYRTKSKDEEHTDKTAEGSASNKTSDKCLSNKTSDSLNGNDTESVSVDNTSTAQTDNKIDNCGTDLDNR